ncbi:MAG: hypothetical protein ACFB6R_03515 [Alphaproteobacteria bacterium]
MGRMGAGTAGEADRERRGKRRAVRRFRSGAAGLICAVLMVSAGGLPARADDAPEDGIDTVRALTRSVDDALDTAAARPVMALPSGFCGIARDPDYADYAAGVIEQMARSGHDVFEIAIPCTEKDVIQLPEAERTGFSQWIIISGHMDETDSPLLDIGMEPEAYFSGLFQEISASTEGIDAVLEDTGLARPEFDAPVQDEDALYWPLVLDLPHGGESMPVRGVAAVTLLGRRPLVTYWYANQSHGVRSAETILTDQRDLTARLKANNPPITPPQDEPAPSAAPDAGSGLSAKGMIGIGIVLALACGLVWRVARGGRPDLEMS